MLISYTRCIRSMYARLVHTARMRVYVSLYVCTGEPVYVSISVCVVNVMRKLVWYVIAIFAGEFHNAPS